MERRQTVEVCLLLRQPSVEEGWGLRMREWSQTDGCGSREPYVGPKAAV